jgi:hypothetical protein
LRAVAANAAAVIWKVLLVEVWNGAQFVNGIRVEAQPEDAAA